jgi:hypothetical protein
VMIGMELPRFHIRHVTVISGIGEASNVISTGGLDSRCFSSHLSIRQGRCGEALLVGASHDDPSSLARIHSLAGCQSTPDTRHQAPGTRKRVEAFY